MTKPNRTFFDTGLPLFPLSGDGVPMTSSTALALTSAAGGLSVSVSRFLGLVRFGSNSLEIPLRLFRIHTLVMYLDQKWFFKVRNASMPNINQL